MQKVQHEKKQKIMFSICMLIGFFVVQKVPIAFANISVTSSGVGGVGGFPIALTSANTVYQLDEDISCNTSCFTVKASNVTLDLNGHTVTFGTANNPGLLNTGMESWIDINTLLNWTVLDGNITQRTAQVWGNYDAELSAVSRIKSDPVTLNPNQTYVYYSMIKGSLADSCTTSLMNNSDDSILASTVINSSLLNRAFSMGGGTINALENNYKVTGSSPVLAYLQIDCTGSSIKRLHIADIKPANHFFLTSNNYRNTSLYPDLADNLFGGTSTGLIIRNGTINQGAGNGVKSAAVYSTAVSNISNVNFNMTGNNTSAMTLGSLFSLDSVSINTSSILNFNRMHAPGSLDFTTAAVGNIEIKNSTFLNDPEQAIRIYNSFLLDSDTHTTSVHNNLIRNREQVTEGYAIVLSGVGNVAIYDNDINPYNGRGILIDAVANRSGYLDGTKNVTIRDNIIQNIHELVTPEFSTDMLEAVAIRVRDWGGTDPPEGHRNLKIYGNTISVYADAGGTHRSYGMNITSSSSNTSAEIYDNVMTASLNSSGGSDWEASCFALQGVDMSLGGSINIHNNICMGNIGVRFGGNDGFGVSGVNFFGNDITANKAVIEHYNYQGPFNSNNIYCNKLTQTSPSGYIVNFESPGSTIPSVSSQFISNNLIVNAGLATVFTNQNYASGEIFCGNGIVSVSGGGSVGMATGACQNGFTGCYSSAGLSVATTYSISSFVSLVSNWLSVGTNYLDLNFDSIINTKDLGIMMSKWQ